MRPDCTNAERLVSFNLDWLRDLNRELSISSISNESAWLAAIKTKTICHLRYILEIWAGMMSSTGPGGPRRKPELEERLLTQINSLFIIKSKFSTELNGRTIEMK